jgi:hypothetical protein
MRNTAVRVSLDIFILAGLFLLPWWVVCLSVLALFLLFRAPEGLLAGPLLDALYPDAFFDAAFFFTLLFLLFLGASQYLRRYIIMYD